MSQAKIGPNNLCPCGSGIKFKKCCQDKRIAWKAIFAAGPHEQVRHLSIRGKNLRFMEAVLGALQMDRALLG
jgi:predicted ester cyclase